MRNHLFPRKSAYIFLMIIIFALSIAFLSMLILLDMLPSDLTIAIEVVMVIMLVLISILLGREKRWKRVIGIFFAVLFLVAFGAATVYMKDTYDMLNKISVAEVSATGPTAKRVDPTQEPFNIYITGIDQWEEEKGLDLERSDVNMIVTVNPVTNKILLTSLPRDSYVKLHTIQQMDKLTHTGIYGVDETLKTVEDWMGININYYVKLNFDAVVDIINAIGGINVYSPVEFESSLRGYKYKKGWNKLGGWRALYFARERKAFEGQDSIRVENQQRVLEAVITSLTSDVTVLMNYGDIMKAAGKNLSTNMSSEEMRSLVQMQVTDLCEWDTSTQKLDGEFDMDYVASLTQSQKFSIYRPNEESVEKIKAEIDELMNPTNEELEEATNNKSRSFFVNLSNSVAEKIKRKIEGNEDEEENTENS